MASSLPEELVQEILVRLPQDEPVHLVHASLVCKAWRRVLSDDRDGFLRRCRGFYGTPPLLGYIQNRIQNRYYDVSPMQFIPANTTASPVRMPAVDHRSWVALDCRHGRVLIHIRDDKSQRRLIVWDLITGSQQHLSVPFASARYPSYSFYNYTGAVLCAKDGCDHLDCHDGPFRMVFVETDLLSPIFICATSYSSLTGAWSAPTPDHITHNPNSYHCFRGGRGPSLLIGDVIYFPFEYTSILKYDLPTHWLSEINKPYAISSKAVLMRTEDEGLGLATLSLDNCIHIWSWQDVTNNDIHGWVKHKVMKLGTLLPRRVPCQSYQVVGFAEGTNTIFINISTGIFTLDLKSKKVRKVGEREVGRFDFILPYMSFYTPRSC